MRSALIANRLPSLDGWRAVSIIMVLGYHSTMIWPAWKNPALSLFFDGNLGVRFFFVISGFLITWLLLKESQQTGNINLKKFYARRCLRILPVYFTYVLVLFILQLFTRFEESPAGWLGTLTFTRNFTDGLAPNGSMGSAHLWSLAVEEQFYLLWPGLFVAMISRSLLLKMAVLAIPILSAPVFRTGTYVFFMEHTRVLPGGESLHQAPVWLLHLVNQTSFFCYDDSLALGCLTAILLTNHQTVLAGYFNQWRTAVFSLGLLLVLAPGALFALGIHGFLRFFLLACGPSLQAAGFSLLIAQSLKEAGWGLYKILNWKCVSWIGSLSYSLYIWQQVFCFRAWDGNHEWRDKPDPQWAWFFLVPTLAAALASYYGLERPLFGLRSKFRRELPFN